MRLSMKTTNVAPSAVEMAFHIRMVPVPSSRTFMPKAKVTSDREMKKKARFATLVALSEYFVAALESYRDRMRA